MTTLLVSGFVVAGLYFGREILIPFALAVLLSFLLMPALELLHRLHIGRLPAALMTVLAAFLAMFAFVAVVAGDLAAVTDQLPGYEANIESKIGSVPGLVPKGSVIDRVWIAVRDLRAVLTRTEARQAQAADADRNRPVPVEVLPPAPTPFETLKAVVGPLLGPIETGGLTAVFVLWILLNREDLRDRLLRLAGGDLHRTTAAMGDAAERVSAYLRRQLAVNAGCGATIGIGLALIGIPYAALWAAMVLLLRFLPYLGIIIAAGFPLALAVAVAPGWSLLLWTALLFVAVEIIVSNLLEPHFYGTSTGLSPIAVIAAAVFWTWLWGPVGLLLSTPLTACLVVIGQHVPQLEFLGVLLGNEPALSPEETFYQRLLAEDPEEATEQAEDFAKAASLFQFFDEVVVPALAMAQADSDRGVLNPERRGMIAQGIATMLENLSDDEPEPPPPGPPGPRLVCVAGRNELDYAAASLLAFLWRREGHGDGEVLPAAALAPEDRRRFEDGAVLCLSVISTNSPVRVRYLVRRLRRRAPRARLLLGIWGEAAEPADGGAPAADAVVLSLRDAVTAISAPVLLEPAVASA